MSPQTIVLFVILLGVLITVHELGHFLIAKLLNVKVLRFSVGFGPKIVGFTRGETEYRIAWIPLGGYVKMAGELPHDEESPEDASRGFLAQPPWKRALIVMGGPAFNLLFPFIIYFFVFFGPHQELAPVVNHVAPGLPAAEAGLQPGDKVLEVAGEPIPSLNRFEERIAQRPGVPTPLLIERDGQQLRLTVTPAEAHATDVFASTRGEIGVGRVPLEPVLGVPQDGSAWAAGLRTFDRVVKVNGQPVPDQNVLAERLAGLEGTATLTVVRLQPLELPGVGGVQPVLLDFEVPLQDGAGLSRLGAEQSDLYVARAIPGGPADAAGLKRGDRLLSVDGEPLASFTSFQIALAQKEEQPFKLQWRRGGEPHEATLARGKFSTPDVLGQPVPMHGVGLTAMGWAFVYSPKVERVTVHLGVAESLKASFERVPEVIGMTVKVIGMLVTGNMPLGTVGGPIMMLQLTEKTSDDYRNYLNLMGAISVNLGIMNLLPIPILDGFALLAALWEAVRRRPIPMRAREIANMVGLAMLLIIMVLVMRNDLYR